VIHAKLEGKFSALMSRVYRQKQAPDQENCKEMHYNVLPKMRCRTLYRASHKTELLSNSNN
jgi:hypothetical protein